MAGYFRLHNKFHRSSHHSLSGTDTVDGGSDPIASKDLPFNGIFYNNLTDQKRTYNISTNSYDWNNVYVTVNALSADWNLAKTTYTTVCANSANWNKGYNSYLTTKSLSSKWESVYTTVCANSAAWSDAQFILLTNKVQENTRSKTFKGYDLTVNQDKTVNWDLDIAQVAFLTLNENDVFLKNPLPSSMKRGGLYNLYVLNNFKKSKKIVRFNSRYSIKKIESPKILHTLNFYSYNIYFDNNYLFPKDMENLINYSVSGVTIFNFFCDGVFMHGDRYRTSASLEENILTFEINKQMHQFNENYFDAPVVRFSEHLDYIGKFQSKEQIFKHEDYSNNFHEPLIRFL
jgi:hypothetical protein